MKQQNQQRHKLNILTYQLQRFLVFLIRINVNCQYWSKNLLKHDKKTLESQTSLLECVKYDYSFSFNQSFFRFRQCRCRRLFLNSLIMKADRLHFITCRSIWLWTRVGAYDEKKNQIWEFYLLHDFVFRVLCFDNRRFYEIANTKMSSRNSKSVSAKGQEASCSLFCGRFLFRGRPASLDSSKPKPMKQVSAGNL